jgi:AraC family transcriptional regulator
LDIASPKESSENRIILKLPALSDRKLHGAILFVLTSGPFFATQALPNEKDTRIGMNRAPFMGATRGERPASALTIQVTPPDIVSRRSAVWTGIAAETIVIARRAPFEFESISPFHRLFASERGERIDGESCLDGQVKSTLRNFSGKLGLVPAGYRYSGWQTPSAFNRGVYIHIDPAGPLLDPEWRFSDVELRPSLFFEDRDLWDTILKLKAQIESPLSRTYAEALGIILAHDLLRLHGKASVARAPQGGLAGWQQKRVAEYIDAHLDTETSLADLANVAKLSPFHFARSFKNSFGEPPHRYLMHRRIERAKALLDDPAKSVMEIAHAVGFSDPASFAAAFHKAVGTTPTSYRRGIR